MIQAQAQRYGLVDSCIHISWICTLSNANYQLQEYLNISNTVKFTQNLM